MNEYSPPDPLSADAVSSDAQDERLAWKNEELKMQLAQTLVELHAARTAMAAIEQELARARESGIVDTLTGLYNRAFFEKEFEKIHAESERGFGYAMIIVDLDHFKEINDTYGHASGDEVLKKIGATLATKRRCEDRVVRWGGDEFIIILPGCKSLHYAAAIAEDVRANIENSECELSSGQRLKITASLGVAFAPPLAADESRKTRLHDRAQSVFNHADLAVYAAKGRYSHDSFVTH